jgi:hypothetical protein
MKIKHYFIDEFALDIFQTLLKYIPVTPIAISVEEERKCLLWWD